MAPKLYCTVEPISENVKIQTKSRDGWWYHFLRIKTILLKYYDDPFQLES